jgi:hypothetical protein
MICIDITFVDMHQLVTTHTQDFLMDISTHKIRLQMPSLMVFLQSCDVGHHSRGYSSQRLRQTLFPNMISKNLLAIGKLAFYC